ncbi:MAG: AraC family transcriptional regulator [Muribaculaceae bacterium]|nr:AraC family transcriptional regulator [Muribaculaceae bacterium]
MKETNLTKFGDNLLQIINLNVDSTEWIARYQQDFILVKNPSFKFSARYPYRLGQVVAIICNEGEAYGAINLRQFHLTKNSLLIVLSEHIMEAYRVSDDFKGIYIFMSQKFLSMLNIGDGYKFYETIDENPCFELEDRVMNAIHSYIMMCKAMINISDINPNTGESLCLLTRLFFLNLGWFMHGNAIGKDTKEHQSDVMDRFLTLVKNNYKEERTVEFYADNMNITAKYLTTVIKKVSGKSALQWIQEYVILDAKTQLSNSMNSIKQISYDLNFPTQSFFGRYFKRATGMSPLEYRRSIRINTSVR